jgi:hypothetical protein
VLLVLLALRQALALELGRDDEARLAPAAERGVDGGDHDVDVGDAAVGGPRLGAVEHPLVLGLVVDGPGLQRRHVGAGVGLGHAERAELHLVGRAEALGHPLHDLLGRAGAGDAGGGQARAEDGEADARVAPEQLLEGDGQRQPGVVTQRRLGEEVEGVEADLGRLLDERPGKLLALVPLLRRRPHDRLREVVDPLLDLLLIFVQLQGELAHGPCSMSTGLVNSRTTGVVTSQ